MKKFIYGILTTLAAFVIMILFYAGSVANTARLNSNLTVYETLTTPVNDFTVDLEDLNETINYRDGLARADIDHVWSDTVSGAGTIDLENLTNTLGESLDLGDEIIMAIKFYLEDDWASSVVISQGAANPYVLLGATYSFTLLANQSLLFKADTNLAVVSATASDIAYDVSNDSTMLHIILISADGYQ